MPGNEHRVIAHGPQALGDAGDQIIVIALRKIGAPDAAGKQHIAHKSTLDLWRIKHHMARRVPRAMAHLQSVRTQDDGVAIGQPARGLEDPRRWKAIGRRRCGQAVDPELVGRVRPDDRQAAQLLSQVGRARCVVHVTVGDPDLFELEAQALDGAQQQVKVAAGIYNSRLMGLIVPDQGTVLLEGGDGDGLVLKHP